MKNPKARFLGGRAALVAFFLVSTQSVSAFVGEIDFTAAEKARHLKGLPTIIDVTTKSMKRFAEVQKQWIAACGVGLLYGFKSSYAKMSETDRVLHLLKVSKCDTPPSVEDVIVTSCEIHTNRFLEKGFAAAGQADLFKRIDQFIIKNGRSGIALGYALSKLGWKGVYFNTDVTQKHPTPVDRRKIGATPDDHAYTYVMAKKNRTYYGVPLDAMMINFAPAKGSKTVQDVSALKALKHAPYFIGVAHGGFHVFPGVNGTIIESHSPYNPENAKNIEIGSFSPPYGSPKGLTVTEDGKKRMSYYYTGVLIIPPGDWLWF